MKLLSLLVCAGWLAHAAEPDPARVRELVEAARRAWDVPGVALAIVKDDQTLYLEGHGVREAGNPEPVTSHTAFQIASATKAFTTASMAMLADERKMAWDEPVKKHLDFFRSADPQADALVTMRDLVSHRTGLPRHDVLWIRTTSSRDDLIRRMAFAKPSASFRSLYQYQNLMFTSAGEAVGKASGLGWDGFVQQRIFLPLGMKDSSTSFIDMLRHTDMAIPHVKGKPNPLRNYDNIGGAGSIASSINDMSRWLRLQLNVGVFEGQRLISEKQLAQTHEPQTIIHRTAAQKEMQPEYTQSSYAMGWFVNHYRGEMLVIHSGSLSGYRALVTMVPRLKLGVVVLANENGTNLNEALTNTLLDEYLALPRTRDWNAHMLAAVKRGEEKEASEKRELEAARKKDTKPSLELDSYIGGYREPAYGMLKVTVSEGTLRAEWAQSKMLLEHWQFDTWRVKQGEPMAGELLHFELNEKGQPAKLTWLGQTFSRQ